MTREELIKLTTDKLLLLSDENLREVSDFAELLSNKIDQKDFTAGIQQLVGDSSSFKFLKDEEDLYSIKDLKEAYR